jgi:hypothetical protein
LLSGLTLIVNLDSTALGGCSNLAHGGEFVLSSPEVPVARSDRFVFILWQKLVVGEDITVTYMGSSFLIKVGSSVNRGSHLSNYAWSIRFHLLLLDGTCLFHAAGCVHLDATHWGDGGDPTQVRLALIGSALRSLAFLSYKIIIAMVCICLDRQV